MIRRHPPGLAREDPLLVGGTEGRVAPGSAAAFGNTRAWSPRSQAHYEISNDVLAGEALAPRLITWA